MTSLTKWILVVMMVIGTGCFGGKRGRGTNLPPDDPNAPPWERSSGGGTTQAVERP